MSESKGSGPIVGIDLGTTNSVIARLTGSPLRPEVIPIDGQRLCPTVVSFESATASPLVGFPARNRLLFAPDQTVREAKRYMGTDHSYNIHGKMYSAPEIQAAALRYMVEKASAAFGESLERAVITVPAFFDQNQRQATRLAGELAGLTVERLINEPTAAALAYHPEGGVRQVLVYDLGGGTFDASLVRMDGSLIEVLASHGDTRLGGGDFDRSMAGTVLGLFAASQSDVNQKELIEAVRQNVGAYTRLVLACEAAKIELSEVPEVVVRCEYLIEMPAGRPRHLEVPFSRSEFEELISEELQRSLRSVERVFQDARMDRKDVDEVLLVGGSTRIPAVAELIQQRFGLTPNRSINPDESVALGAAVQAGIMSGAQVDKVLVDVAAFPLSISTLSLFPDPRIICRVITPRNTPIPSRHSEVFSALHPKQEKVRIHIFQGGNINPRKNRCIGALTLTGLKRRGREDVASLFITFKTNLDGVVEASISNPGSGRSQSAKVTFEGLGTQDMMEDFLALCGKDGLPIGPPPGWRPEFGADIGLEEFDEDLEDEDEDDLEDDLGEDEDEDDDEDDDEAEDEAEELTGSSSGGDGTSEYPEVEQTLRRIEGQLPKLLNRPSIDAAKLKDLVFTARLALAAQPMDDKALTKAMDALTDYLFDCGEFF